MNKKRLEICKHFNRKVGNNNKCFFYTVVCRTGNNRASEKSQPFQMYIQCMYVCFVRTYVRGRITFYYYCYWFFPILGTIVRIQGFTDIRATNGDQVSRQMMCGLYNSFFFLSLFFYNSQ